MKNLPGMRIPVLPRHGKTLHPRRFHRGLAGSGLLENLFALAIFSSGITGVMSLVDEVQFTNELSDQTSTATTLARSKFEDLRTRDPEERTALGLTSGTAGPLNASGVSSPAGSYTLTWVIQDSVPHAGLQMVTITVQWVDNRSHRRAYQFESGLRKGWPLPVIIPATQMDHGHGNGHQ